jgi:Tfp pilus assembly protein PilF
MRDAMAAPAPPVRIEAKAGRRKRRGLSTLIGIFAVAWSTVLVYLGTRPRTPAEDAPPAVGGAPAPSDAAHPSETKEVERLLDQARDHLAARDLSSAWEETRDALKISPDSARGLTYEGLIRSAMGQPEAAAPLFERAIAARPDILEPRLQLAFVYVKLGRDADAEATIAAASRRFPEKASAMTRLLVRMREQVARERASGRNSARELPRPP